LEGRNPQQTTREKRSDDPLQKRCPPSSDEMPASRPKKKKLERKKDGPDRPTGKEGIDAKEKAVAIVKLGKSKVGSQGTLPRIPVTGGGEKIVSIPLPRVQK